LHPKKARVVEQVKVENPVSVYKDKAFWVFFVAMFIFGFVFLQYFSTIPLYYKDVRFLSELEIGLLMGFSGLVIFIFEMPVINWLQNTKNSKIKLVAIGLFLVAMSYIVLNLTSWIGVLLIGMLLMTIGEMIAFPFSNSYAVERSAKGNQGEYMALYSISFSLAHIFSHNLGMQMIAKYGYEFTWNFITAFALLGVLILIILLSVLKREEKYQSK
jgi:predicted MFS family arabinose efflux permease